MAVGCPVVVTAEVGLADVINETGSGIVSDGDPQSLAAQLKRILANEFLRQKMGKAGQKAVIERFTWEVVGKTMEQVYENLLSDR
jgi:glycosyltransferase involved in cell wall biosynthesis